MIFDGIAGFIDQILQFILGLVPDGLTDFLEGIFGNIFG